MFDLTGTLGFSYPKKPSILSRMIRHITDSDYSHVFVCAGSFLNQPMVLEASFDGVDVTTWRRYDSGYSLALYIPNPEYISKSNVDLALLKVASEHLGTAYGYFDLVKMAFSYIVRSFGVDYIPPRSKNMVCTQFGLTYLRSLPEVSDQFESVDIRLVSPKILEERIEKTGYFTKIVINN